jgi:hypothetical protein
VKLSRRTYWTQHLLHQRAVALPDSGCFVHFQSSTGGDTIQKRREKLHAILHTDNTSPDYQHLHVVCDHLKKVDMRKNMTLRSHTKRFNEIFSGNFT